MSSKSSGAPLLRQDWDVVVVGTGPGGAATGYALASMGKRVLFCEAGGPLDGSFPSRFGHYPELELPRRGRVPMPADSQVLRSAGRYTGTVNDIRSGRRSHAFIPFIGSGPGGSSALFGMAMERFNPGDFAGRATGGAAADLAPLEWPIGYAELAPYYANAERLFQVRGEVDPLLDPVLPGDQRPQLLPPTPASPAAEDFARLFRGNGMHPYQLPLACARVEGCDTCQGVLCPKSCKQDAFSVAARPAIEQHGAGYLGGCRVNELIIEGRRVAAVRATWRGQAIELRAPVIVLAAGALQTPTLLLRSRSSLFPDGIGNHSGMVGRCLMRHFVDLYVVKVDPDRPGFDGRRKELAFNDLYLDGDGNRLGTVQSFGSLPPPAMLFGSLQDDVGASRMPWAAGLLPFAKPVLMPFLAHMTKGAMIFATIAEDLPYTDNLVRPSAESGFDIDLCYSVKAEARHRIGRFRRHAARLLEGQSWRLLPQAENNQRLAHACGTCRFGNDPKTSVLDRDNRVHGAENVFVVDSSFFPTSGGTNPSLTIAANALRVGELIARQMF